MIEPAQTEDTPQNRQPREDSLVRQMKEDKQETKRIEHAKEQQKKG